MAEAGQAMLQKEVSCTFNIDTGLAVPETAILMVFITIFMDMLAASISTPALPSYASKQFGASKADIGYLFASWSFMSAFCAPLLSQLADGLGRKKVLIASLIGAGMANVGQATAPSYWVLFAWRAFSGVWAAVQSTAQVYLTDVCRGDVLHEYMSKLSAVPGIAMMFGPALGGGLSSFGLNLPILIDGLLSLAAAGLVCIYLPESPQWLARDKSKQDAASPSQPRGRAPAASTRVPRATYLLGASCFLFGVAFGTRVSMQVVALQAKLGLSVLQVGYVYAVMAVATFTQGFWITPRLQRWIGVPAVGLIGTLLHGACMPLAFGVMEGKWPCLFFVLLGNAASALRQAANGSLSASLADATNRGAVFGQVQMFTNCGRLVGPLVAGNLADVDPLTWPWIMTMICCLISAAVLLVVHPLRGKPQAQPVHTPTGPIVRGFTDLQERELDLEPEVGKAEDYERVGRFVGELLQRRYYRWVSRQEAVLEMIDHLLPPLRATGAEQYKDLEVLSRYARQVQFEFNTMGGDRQL